MYDISQVAEDPEKFSGTWVVVTSKDEGVQRMFMPLEWCLTLPDPKVNGYSYTPSSGRTQFTVRLAAWDINWSPVIIPKYYVGLHTNLFITMSGVKQYKVGLNSRSVSYRKGSLQQLGAMRDVSYEHIWTALFSTRPYLPYDETTEKALKKDYIFPLSASVAIHRDSSLNLDFLAWQSSRVLGLKQDDVFLVDDASSLAYTIPRTGVPIEYVNATRLSAIFLSYLSRRGETEALRPQKIQDDADENLPAAGPPAERRPRVRNRNRVGEVAGAGPELLVEDGRGREP